MLLFVPAATPHMSSLSTFFLVFEFCEHDLAGLLSNVNVKFNLGEIKKVRHVHCRHLLSVNCGFLENFATLYYIKYCTEPIWYSTFLFHVITSIYYGISHFFCNQMSAWKLCWSWGLPFKPVELSYSFLECKMYLKKYWFELLVGRIRTIRELRHMNNINSIWMVSSGVFVPMNKTG